MFIRQVINTIQDKNGKMCCGKTNYGKFKNVRISIEIITRNGVADEKEYCFWDGIKQILKIKRNKNGKFEVIS